MAYDLRVFFAVVGKSPRAVRSADVLAFVTAQRTGGTVDGPLQVVRDVGGVSARTVRRRLSSVSGLFAFPAICAVDLRQVMAGGARVRLDRP